MEKFSSVSRGQNVITTVNGVVKTRTIADKVERDTFKADVQKIIDSKKADSTKEKELLAMFVSKEAKREEVKKAIVQVAEKVKEVKKKEKELKKEPIKEVKETKKEEVVKAYDIESAKRLIHNKIYSFRNHTDFLKFKMELIQEIVNDKGEF